MLFVGTWMLVSCLDSAMTGDAIAASVGAASASTRSLLGMLCPFQDGWDEASIRRLSIAIDADKTASARLKFRGVPPHTNLLATNAVWCGAQTASLPVAMMYPCKELARKDLRRTKRNRRIQSATPAARRHGHQKISR
jgi:hypothetical protein